MGIPIVYRKSGEGAIASYDFFDIAAGTGYETFYIGEASGAQILTNVSFYSDRCAPRSDNSSPGGGWILQHDNDYDVEINLPRIIKGEMICNVPYGVLVQSAAGIHASIVYVRLRKYDGTTETEIASGAVTHLSFTPTVVGYKRLIGAGKITVPQTKLIRGDKLRLTIEQWAAIGAGSSSGAFFYGSDPNNRNSGASDTLTWGSEISQSSFIIPFKIDL